jgi:hypothetical protein
MIELTCTHCGAVFVPTRDDVLRGPAWYRLCPSCRPSRSAAMSPALDSAVPVDSASAGV